MIPIRIEITAKTSKMWIRLLGAPDPLKKNPNIQAITKTTAIR